MGFTLGNQLTTAGTGLMVAGTTVSRVGLHQNKCAIGPAADIVGWTGWALGFVSVGEAQPFDEGAPVQVSLDGGVPDGSRSGGDAIPLRAVGYPLAMATSIGLYVREGAAARDPAHCRTTVDPAEGEEPDEEPSGADAQGPSLGIGMGPGLGLALRGRF